MSRIILDLCSGTGSWSKPYMRAGYDVRRVEIEKGQDVRTLEFPGHVHGILAAPPCTNFCRPGAQYWKEKGEAVLIDSLSIVDACLRLALICKPKWWALENPPGRLNRFMGKHQFRFEPWWYGDPWTKLTYLWGDFNFPEPLSVVVPIGSLCTDFFQADTKDRTKNRSKTPSGFARAFFMANP